MAQQGVKLFSHINKWCCASLPFSTMKWNFHWHGFPDHIAGLVLLFTNICYCHPLGTICYLVSYRLTPPNIEANPSYLRGLHHWHPASRSKRIKCSQNKCNLTGPCYCSAAGDMPTENKSHACNPFPVTVQNADADEKPRGALAETPSPSWLNTWNLKREDPTRIKSKTI